MKLTLIFFASPWAHLIFRFFRRLGALGLLLLGVLDSSFLVLPFGNDLLLIALVASSHSTVERILYVLMSTVGSVIGVFIVDLLMRKAGETGLKRFMKPKGIKRIRQWVETRTGRFIFLATLTPPPFPFTPIIMTASALQVSRKKLFGNVFLGRLVRFGIEAILAVYFGRTLIRYMNSDAVEYVVYAIILIAAVGSALSIVRWVGGTGRLGTNRVKSGASTE